MSSVGPRLRELFAHLRQAVHLIEELMSLPQVAAPRPELRPAQKSALPMLNPQKLAYSIKEIRALIGISNTSIYKQIAEGRLRAVKRGNRTIILAYDLQNWVSSWPGSRSSAKPG